jgi:Rrf2 family protein
LGHEVVTLSPRASANLGWYRVAVQALVVLAGSDQACSSSAIAEDVDAHAVFLRRVLAQLARVKIVAAREGRDGGYRLARPADQITLSDVYQAVNLASTVEELTAEHCGLPEIDAVLDDVGDRVEQQTLKVLAQYTIASIVESTAQAQHTA